MASSVASTAAPTVVPQLKSRENFADLRLREKNTYLQELANHFQGEAEEDQIVLSKAALSRLRRFYSRRSVADLKLSELDDGAMRDALVRMAGIIRESEIAKVIQSELPASRKDTAKASPEQPREEAKGKSVSTARIIRLAPEGDEQLDFFVPQVHDAPLKDEMNLMDIAPFALSKVRRDGVIRYELKDSIITIEGGAEVGLATTYDYDIFLSMVS